MSNRKLVILGIVAVVTLVLAVVLSNRRSLQHVSTEPTYLVQGLPTEVIASIEIISKGSPLVSLARRGGEFVVTNKDDYPALANQINALVAECVDIKTSELITSNPENHVDLGVTESDAYYVVKFFDTDNRVLTGVVVSEPNPESAGVYVRLLSGNDVYLMVGKSWPSFSEMNFIETRLITAAKDEIIEVTVIGPAESYTLKSAPGSDEIVLEEMPEGRKFKDKAQESVFTALTDMQFTDVQKAASAKNLKFDTSYICRLSNMVVYTLSIAGSGDDFFVTCDADFTGDKTISKAAGVESEQQLKVKEAKLLARDAAADFSKKHTGWLYKIDSSRAGDLTKPLSDLLEDKEKPIEPDPAELSDTEANLG